MLKTMLLLLALFYAANSISGTTYVPVPNTSVSMIGADGAFKCGGRIFDVVDTKASALTCTVIDQRTCTGFLRTSDCKEVVYSYKEYAQYRAKLEGKKVKYLGMAPMYVGRDSDFQVFVFVEVIPQ